MRTNLLQKKYLEILSSKLDKLNLEVDIFLARANKTAGLAKAKYLERVKAIQEKRDILTNLTRQITEGGDQLERSEFRSKINRLLKEIDKATEEERQQLIELFS